MFEVVQLDKIDKIEEEYKSFETKNESEVSNVNDFCSYAFTGICETKDIIKDYNRELRENKRWQLAGKIRNFFNFIFQEEEVEFYDYDNKILEDAIILTKQYAEIYKRLIVLADDDNYMELLKLIDFASIYYDSNIEYFEYLRDCLEMNLKGYSMCNSRYSDTREEFGKFVDKKISEYEDEKVYKLKKVTS